MTHKKMYGLLFFVLCTTLSTLSFAGKAITLTEIVEPHAFVVDEENIYLTEGVTVFIYSKKDYHLVKKFGKEGEGPGEVLLRRNRGNTQIEILTQKDRLIVRSVNKIIYFSKEGTFLDEKKTQTAGQWLTPVDDLLVGKRFLQEPDGVYHGVILFDSNLNKLKEIYKHIHGFQGPTSNIEFNPLTMDQADYNVCGDKIFVIDGARTKILIYDKSGELLSTITPKDPQVKFTDKDKKEMVDEYNRNEFWKRLYNTKRDLFKFPEYFPPIRMFDLDPIEKKVYIKTELQVDKNCKWYIFTFQGKFIKEILLPPGWLRFFNGISYRLLLVDEGDNERWELYVEKIN